jgi:hypothetical protein
MAKAKAEKGLFAIPELLRNSFIAFGYLETPGSLEMVVDLSLHELELSVSTQTLSDIPKVR